MAEHKNKFMNASRGNVNLRDLTQSVNNMNRTQPTPKTEKRVEDIDIDLIDIGEMNEQLFGYEDIGKIKESFSEIGNHSVIYVYTRGNGRYLCYAGNQRLIASRQANEKKITCVISGPEPDEEQMLKDLMFMNAQRTPRAYYIARQVEEYEKILRRKGNKAPSEEIEQKLGIKAPSQRKYRQILKLDPVLQELFKRDDIPAYYLIEVCNKIPEDKTKVFADLFLEKCENEEPSREMIGTVYKKALSSEETVAEKTTNRPKFRQVFKDIISLPYFEQGETIEIPESKRDDIIKQVDLLEDYIKRIREQCG
ncbi:MAG: hypothetical protein K6E91_09845 [Butyrivibrio sp.]|nr:hypothetical protein [Butyrivibrio sp.]